MKISKTKFVKSALSLFLVLLMLLSAGMTSIIGATVDLVSTGYDVSANTPFYFHDRFNWGESDKVFLMIGHGSYSTGYEMSKISNTDLYYVNMPSWGGATQIGVFAASAVWGAESSTVQHRAAYATKSAYFNMAGNYSGTFLLTPEDDGKSKTLTPEYQGSSYSALNKNHKVGVKLAENGSTTYTESTTSGITVTASSYKLSSASGTTATSGTTVSAVRSADVTLSYSGVPTGYTFKGWYDSDGTQVASSETYIYEASYTEPTYYAYFEKPVSKVTATFNNWDGTVLQSGQVEVGSTPVYSGATPTKPADAQYTYTFRGWEPALGNINTDTTYTAQFTSTVNKYTATFKNATDGTASTVTENYGTTITLPAGPAKAADDTYVYNFTNWTCSADSKTYNAGASYELTSNVTFTPNYSQSIKGIDVDIVNTNANGTVSWNSTQNVEGASGVINVPSGTNTTLKITPDSGFYVSSVKVGTTEKVTTLAAGAIDVNIGTITAETTVTVTYTANPKVTVSQTGGTVTGTGSVEYGSGKQVVITAPSGKYISSVTGAAGTYSQNNTVWTVNLTNITSDVSISATYAAKPTVTVTQTGGNGTVKVNGADYTAAVTVEYNSNVSVSVTAPKGYYISKYGSTTNTNQTLTSTTATISAVKSSTTYAIAYTPIDYDVTVKVTPTAGGTATGAGQYAYGSTVTLKATEKTGYTFTRWDLTGDYTLSSGYDLTDSEIEITVDGDVEAEAIFLINTYTVTFKDGYTEEALDTQEVQHGSAATAPADPTRTGYTFAGWDKTFSDITGDTIVTAQWTANVYNVSVSAGAGGTAASDVTSFTYNENGSVVLTASPDAGYAFNGWTVTGDYNVVSGSEDSTTFAILPTSDITASASFVEGKYLTVYSYSENGNNNLTITENNGSADKTINADSTGTTTFGDDAWENYGQLELTNGYYNSVTATLSGDGAAIDPENQDNWYVDGKFLVAPGYKTVVVTNNHSWSMNIHIFDSANGDKTSWPGVAMKKAYTNDMGQGVYVYLVPDGWDQIKFVNNSNTAYKSKNQTISSDIQAYWIGDGSSSTEYALNTWTVSEDDQYTGSTASTSDITSYLYTGSTWNNKTEVWLYDDGSTLTATDRRALLDELAADKADFDATNDSGKWTPETWTAFESAYNAALAVINDPASEQSAIDNATTTLDAAHAALQLQAYWTVTFNHSGATGTVSGDTQIVSGQSATFTVTAPTGYYVSAVTNATLTAPGKVAEVTIASVTADTEVTITYAKNPTITVNQTGGTADGDGSVEYGADQTVTITAPSGSYISAVTGAEGTYSNNNTVYVITLTDIKSDVTIDVTYKTKPVVTVTENIDGTVTINSSEVNSATVEYNTKPSISITAPEGYFISSILVNGIAKYTNTTDETVNTYSINDTVTANTLISVTYTERTEYTVTIDAYDSANGTIKIGDTTVPAEGGSYTFYAGENVTVTATSAEGKSVDFWTVNGTDGYNGDDSIDLTVDDNMTIALTWKDISIYNVTVDANPFGAGTATGEVSGNVTGETSISSAKDATQSTKVEEGGSATFTATVTDKIYKFTGWKITGIYSLTEGSLTDDEITIIPMGDVKVVATYEQAYKVIYLENSANWSQPYIYYWGSSEAIGHPGKTMTKVEGSSTRWYATIPMDATTIQFNTGNSSNQVEYSLANYPGKNTFSNDKNNTNYPATTVEEGYYLQGTWNEKDYSAYDQIKFDENRDGTYSITIEVTSAPDGYILVTPSDEKSNFWVPATDLDTTNPTTLTEISYAATHNQVKVPLDMVASPSGYTVTFTFNPEDGTFSWVAVKKVPTTSVYGTDGFKKDDAGKRVGDTYFEIGGAVLDADSVAHYEKAEVAIDEFFSVFTKINPATDSPVGLYEWYVAGYVVNGKRFVTADKLADGLYSADLTITAEEADADIVPIYFHTPEYLAHYGIKTTTFYAVIPEGIDNWTDDNSYLSAYTWYYKDEENDSSYAPFGKYPGQLMIPITGLDGVYYTIVEAMAPFKNSDGSTIYVDGVTLNNYNDTAPSNENTTYVQTYDYYEFLSYTIQELENITFVLKNHNTNYNKLDISTTSINVNNFQFIPLTNYNNDVIDIFGNVLDKAHTEQVNFNAAVAEGNVIHAVRVGNKDYRDTECTLTHYDAKTGELVDCPLNGQWYADMYLYDNDGNFLVRCHSYQLSDGNLWQLFNDQRGTNYASREEFQEDYAGYAVKVSYETDTVVKNDGGAEGGNGESTSNRFDGEWYADTDNTVTIDISVNVGLSTDEGKTFTPATDAEGNPTNTAEYGTALVNGAASVSVTRNSQVTLLAERKTGYRFIGWATADGKIFSNNISETVDVAISTSYTAVYQKLEAGYFYLNHEIYGGAGTADKDEIPTAHNGRGDLYVQIEKLENGVVTEDTGLLKQNTAYLAAQEGDTLRLTIATDPAGIDTFFAWYVNALNASGLLTYEEVGVDSFDNLAMPGNGGTYTNPDTVLGEKGLVYFQFMHTVGKQFNLTLYSDMIRVTSNKKLTYKYLDRNGAIRTYVVNYELTPEEIEGFEGNHNREYTPSDATISKYAPFVGDYYKDIDWIITEFAADECLLWGVGTPKKYTVTVNVEGAIGVEQVDYNSVLSLDASEYGSNSKGGFWYKDTNGNLAYDEGVDVVIANGTWYSYRVTENMTIGYVSQKVNDFNVSLDAPVYGREQETDDNGENKTDKVLVDYIVNMVTPNVYGDGSGFEYSYNGQGTDKNMAGNMVTIESYLNEGYKISYGVLLEQVALYRTTDSESYKEAVANAQAVGYGTSTNADILKGLIENNTFGSQPDGDLPRYYVNYDCNGYTITNKNRFLFTISLENTEYNRAAFYNVYSYMIVEAPDGTKTVYVSNVQTLNIYPTATTNVAEA